MVVVAVLFLVIFGPSKMPQMARDIGKFVGQARGAIDEFKDELTAETPDETDSPTRSREEGSRRCKNGQNQANGSSGKDDEEEESEEGSSESKQRERAEYDL